MGAGRGARIAAAVGVLAAVAVGCLAPAAARADDSSIGTIGGSARPIWNTGVRLAAETVQATCFNGFAEYRVDFEFRNDGPPRTVKLGFPFIGTQPDEEGLTPPIGFQAWQDGRPLTVTTVASHWFTRAQVGYYVHTAHFRHGTTMITVSYLAWPSSSAMARLRGVDPDDLDGGTNAAYTYWLHTGATWRGTIGTAVVRYRLADTFDGTDIDLPAWRLAENAYVTAPGGWTCPLSNTYQWRFTDFEPTTEAHAGKWWLTQSPYDVTLAYTSHVLNQPDKVTWRASSIAGGDAAGFGGEDGADLLTGWTEGAPGLGVGQWVEARFKHATHLGELRIVPGKTDYASAFERYARPRTMLAVFSNGTRKLLRFRDAPSLQRFPVDVTTRWVRLVIRSAYRGTDYPATCLSIVELAAQRAPGYASFPSLIDDPAATGSLPAWAGPPAPVPGGSSGQAVAGGAPAIGAGDTAADQPAIMDYENDAGGDLLGVGSWEMMGYPADGLFRQPSSLAALRAMDPTVRLPAARLVGRVTAVHALSYQTFEVTCSSGVDLLVNTRAGDWPVRSLAAVRKDETESMDQYTDGRIHPFDITTIGSQKVGLGQPGAVPPSSGVAGYKVPGELFWCADGVSYHLYAPSDAATSATLMAAARSMILPPPAPRPRVQTKSAKPWWPGVIGTAIFVVLVVAVLFGARRRRAADAMPEAGR